MKRLLRLAAVLTAVSLLALAGCRTTSEPKTTPAPSTPTTPSTPAPKQTTPAPTVRAGGTLTMGMRVTGLPTADPHKSRTISSHTLAALVADPLVRFEGGKVVGVLAQSWDVSPDGLAYTFTLRKASFHNGKPVTGASIKSNIDRIMDPKNPLYAAGSLSNVNKVEAVGENQVRFTLKKLDPDFLLSLLQVWMVDADSAAELGESFDKAPIGSGPFKVTKFVPDQEMVMERFDKYWGGDPQLDKIVVKPIPDPDTLTLELKAGTVDVVTFVPMKDIESLKAAKFQVLDFGRVNTAVLAINNKTVPDIPLRQAICYAVDSAAILKNAYKGQGTLMKGIAIPGSWAYDDKLGTYDYKPDAAKKILDDAGWKDTNGDGIREKDGKPIVLDFPSRSDGEWLGSTEMIQQMLKAVGVDSKIRTSDSSTYYSAVRTGAYDIGWWLTNYRPEPPVAAANLHSKEYWNVKQVKYPKLDELIDKAQSTVNQAERAAAYKEVALIHHQEALECPSIWVLQSHAASGKVQGIYTDPLGIMHNGHLWKKGS